MTFFKKISNEFCSEVIGEFKEKNESYVACGFKMKNSFLLIVKKRNCYFIL
jgi:hypothetical protein